MKATGKRGSAARGLTLPLSSLPHRAMEMDHDKANMQLCRGPGTIREASQAGFAATDVVPCPADLIEGSTLAVCADTHMSCMQHPSGPMTGDCGVGLGEQTAMVGHLQPCHTPGQALTVFWRQDSGAWQKAEPMSIWPDLHELSELCLMIVLVLAVHLC